MKTKLEKPRKPLGVIRRVLLGILSEVAKLELTGDRISLNFQHYAAVLC